MTFKTEARVAEGMALKGTVHHWSMCGKQRVKLKASPHPNGQWYRLHMGEYSHEVQNNNNNKIETSI